MYVTGVLLPTAHLPFWMEGVLYPSLEHYHWCSRVPPIYHDQIRRMRAEECYHLGKGLPAENLSLKRNEENLLDAICCLVLQHSVFHQALLETGDEELVYRSDHDYIWGTGKHFTGRNLLGKCLMEIRRKLFL